MFKKFLEYGYNAALLFLFTFANLLILTSVLFFFNITISVFHLPISFVFSVIELYFLRKPEVIDLMISSFLIIIVFLISLLLCGRVFDNSYDGNAYHKEAVGFLKVGWNPVYESAEEFGKENSLGDRHHVWLNSYPKATWFYGASVYKITDNIETAKTFNLIILFVVFFIVAYLINKFYEKKVLSLLMAILVVSFPIMCQQIFSLYLDGFLGFCLLLTLIYMYLIIKNDKYKEYFFIIGALLIIIINVKFTGLMYAGIFCLGYYIYYLIGEIRSKEYKQLGIFTGKFLIILAVSLLIVGSNSYIKNLVVHKNPLYPLIGKDKMDIMTYLQPESFADMSPIEKNFYALFSRTANIGVFNHGEPVLKIPFVKSDYEVSQFGEDTRIGGFGVYFSGIFIISTIVIIIYMIAGIVHKKYDDLIMIGIPFLLIILIMFCLSDGWWARYAPQVWFISLMAVFLLLKDKKWFIKFLGILLFALCIDNSYIIINHMVKSRIPTSGLTRQTLENNKGKKLDIKMTSPNFSGTLFNLKDFDIEYKIKDQLTDADSLYSNVIFYKRQK